MNLMIRHKIVLLTAVAAVLPVMAVVLFAYHEKRAAMDALRVEADLLTRRNIESVALDAYHMVKMVHQMGDREKMEEGLRQAIMDLRVGKTGYVAVVGGKGDDKGEYIISLRGQRDGEDILQARDPNGNFFVKELIDIAIHAPEGAVRHITYPWQNKGDPAPRNKIAVSVYFEEWDWVIAATAYEDDFDNLTQGIESSLDELTRWTLLGGATITVLTIVVALFLGNRIGRQLASITQVAEKLTRGDLEQQLDYQSADEIGRLAAAFRQLIEFFQEIAHCADRLSQGDLRVQFAPRSKADVLSLSFERMAKSLHSIFSRLTEHATHLNKASQSSSTVSEQTTSSLGSVNQSADTVAAAADQMSSDMRAVSVLAQHTDRTLETVADGAREMLTSIKQIIQSTAATQAATSSAVQTVAQSARDVDELGQSVRDIGNVIEIIAEIADQTKLLALNATIEAASAGDAGKGFSVVANEVKELAKQTGEATDEIRARVEAIQHSASTTVSQINQISDVIQDVDQHVTTVSQSVGGQERTTRAIVEQILETGEEVGEMATNVQRTTEASEGIAADVADVSVSAHEVSTAMSQVNKQAIELAEMGAELRALIEHYRLS